MNGAGVWRGGRIDPTMCYVGSYCYSSICMYIINWRQLCSVWEEIFILLAYTLKRDSRVRCSLQQCVKFQKQVSVLTGFSHKK